MLALLSHAGLGKRKSRFDDMVMVRTDMVQMRRGQVRELNIAVFRIGLVTMVVVGAKLECSVASRS